MNIFASFRYQVADQKRSIFIYYSVLLALLVVCGVLLFVPLGRQGGIVTNGITSISTVFLFVVSLCSFKDNFGMSLQHGVPRRSLFLGRLCTTGAVCAVMAVADELLTRLLALPAKLLGVNISSNSFFETIYGEAFAGTLNPFWTVLCSLAFSFFVLIAASAVGYFITILFYRLNKMGKILVGAGVPVFLSVGVPVLKMLNEHIADGKIGEAVVRFIAKAAQFCVGQPQNAMLTYLAVFALFSAFSWLLMRRAVVK